jgi:hypothetical protein
LATPAQEGSVPGRVPKAKAPITLGRTFDAKSGSVCRIIALAADRSTVSYVQPTRVNSAFAGASP